MASQTRRSTRPKGEQGFSLTELVVVLAISLIITGASVIQFLNTWNSYKVSSGETQVASMIKQCRTEAIRRNTQISCRFAQDAVGNWFIWADLPAPGAPNGDGVRQLNEPQTAIVGPITLFGDGVAPAGASMGLGATTNVLTLPAPPSVTFDSRGAVVNGGPGGPTVLVVFLGYSGAAPGTSNPTYGYRAVSLLPTGKTQNWTATAGGVWSTY